MNNYVTVPSAVNLFVAAVCWLVSLFFSSVWSDCVNRGSKRARVWSTSEWYAFTPVNTDRFPLPVGGRINGFHRSLFCNCCCCLFLSSRNSSSWRLNKEEKPCLATKIFQWSMTTQVSSKSEWLTHRARYKTVVKPFFRAPYSLWYGGAPKQHLRQRLNKIKISLDHRLAGFLSTAFYNLQSGVFLLSVRNRKPFALENRLIASYAFQNAYSSAHYFLNFPIFYFHDTNFYNSDNILTIGSLSVHRR